MEVAPEREFTSAKPRERLAAIKLVFFMAWLE